VKVHGIGTVARLRSRASAFGPPSRRAGERCSRCTCSILGDLYAAHVRVEFLHKIRDEEKYPDLETLKTQIERDCEAAKSFLMDHRNA